MRGEDDIVEATQRNVVGQRLVIVDVETRAADLAL